MLIRPTNLFQIKGNTKFEDSSTGPVLDVLLNDN